MPVPMHNAILLSFKSDNLDNDVSSKGTIDLTEENDNVVKTDHLNDGKICNDIRLINTSIVQHNLEQVTCPGEGNCCPFATAFSYQNHLVAFNAKGLAILTKLKQPLHNATRKGDTLVEGLKHEA